MDFVDTITLDGEPRVTRDGYLVVDAKTARTGIQVYRGIELGRPDLGSVRVYRPPEEVFHADAMASMAHRPMTNDHPSEMVNAGNWKKYSIGSSGGDVVRDGAFIRIPLTMMDAGAISDYRAGKRELSWGYTAEIEFGDGVTPEGEQFDAQQKSIRANHIALCKTGRAGPDYRFGDQREPDMAVKTIQFDGLPLETTDAGEAAIRKLEGQITAGAKAVTDAEAAHAVAIVAKDAKIAALDAEIAVLKPKILDAAAMDAAVAARAKLITDAKKIAPTLVTDGKDDAGIRREAVLAKLGDAHAAKDAAFFDTAFALLLDGAIAPAAADPIRGAIIAGGGASITDAQAVADAAWAAENERQANAWKNVAA